MALARDSSSRYEQSLSLLDSEVSVHRRDGHPGPFKGVQGRLWDDTLRLTELEEGPDRGNVARPGGRGEGRLREAGDVGRRVGHRDLGEGLVRLLQEAPDA